jgi:hypothetical protein
MKTLTPTTLFFSVTLIAGLSGVATVATAAENWQERRLLHPTAAEIESEKRGRVFIYDRLQEGVVDEALDENFSRIDSMMFVRMRHPAPANSETSSDGENESQEGGWEDDDC